MNEELDTVDSAPDWVFIAPRNVVNDAFSGSADPTRIAGDKAHVISRESIHDALTDKRIEVAKADVILAINLNVLSIVACSHPPRIRLQSAIYFLPPSREFDVKHCRMASAPSSKIHARQAVSARNRAPRKCDQSDYHTRERGKLF